MFINLAVSNSVTLSIHLSANQTRIRQDPPILGKFNMPKSPAYARFLNAMAVERKESPDPQFEGCEEILAYLSIKEESNQPVKVTDLVHALQFGTGPTVHRKVSTLSARGFIKVLASKTDGRTKNLSLTKAGEELLKERTKLMASMLKA